MKVLFAGRYNESEVLNGPEKVAKRIFHESSEENNSCFAEYFFDGRKYSFFKKLFGFEEVTKINGSVVIRFGILKLLFHLFKTKPEIIHIITYERFAVICFLFKIFSNAKIIYNVHGIISYENTILNKTNSTYALKDKICEYIFFKYSDKLIFLSERSIELSKKYCTIYTDKIEIIPNGTDEIFYSTGISKKINYSEPLNIVFAGDEERKEKGLKYLIESVSDLQFRLNIFIIGNFSHDVKINNSNIEIKMIQKMDSGKLSLFLSDKDVFVSASSYEQFSITAVECMAAGMAPIVTEETGMSSYINNEVNGFIIKHGDVEMLINTLDKLNYDRKILKSISENAVSIFEQLSWNKIFERYKTFYK